MATNATAQTTRRNELDLPLLLAAMRTSSTRMRCQPHNYAAKPRVANRKLTIVATNAATLEPRP